MATKPQPSVEKPQVKPKPPVKPGWQTSEFGVTAASILLAASQVAEQFAEPMAQQGHSQTAMWLAGLAALGYNISRGMAKRK